MNPGSPLSPEYPCCPGAPLGPRGPGFTRVALLPKVPLWPRGAERGRFHPVHLQGEDIEVFHFDGFSLSDTV